MLRTCKFRPSVMSVNPRLCSRERMKPFSWNSMMRLLIILKAESAAASIVSYSAPSISTLPRADLRHLSSLLRGPLNCEAEVINPSTNGGKNWPTLPVLGQPLLHDFV